MAESQKLEAAQVILLAAHLASESNIHELETLLASRQDILKPELAFRILLTLLPETLEPSAYTPILIAITREEPIGGNVDTYLDVRPVKDLSAQDVTTRLRQLRLVKLHDSPERLEAVQDPLTLFLIHRAHRIDRRTGLLTLIPDLVSPFIDRTSYLRIWFISTVLPLLRRDYEFHPLVGLSVTLKDFEKLQGQPGIQGLLGEAAGYSNSDETVSRYLRSVIGPWICGSAQRERHTPATGSDISIEAEAILNDWQAAFQWLVGSATGNLSLAAAAYREWEGPSDVDFGGYQDPGWDQDESRIAVLHHLRSRYCQAAFASIYAAEDDSSGAFENVYSIVNRLSELCGFESPTPLAQEPSLLPTYKTVPLPIDELPKTCLQYDTLCDANQILTSPSDEAFALLQLFLASANLLGSVGHPISVSKVAKLRLHSDESEQLRLLQKLMHSVNMGVKKDEAQWTRVRHALLWLWSWGIPPEGSEGHGILGKIRLAAIEKELLKAICSGSHYSLAVQTYLGTSPSPLSNDEVERVVVDIVLNFYDNASNGNRTRGGVKKASDALTAFRKALPSSPLLGRCSALIAATHALSFYSLTLVSETPLQPRSIREFPDPVSLISKVLHQNPHSYTKLEDFVQIGRNLVIALDGDPTFSSPEPTPSSVEAARASRTERRIVGLAVEAALAEDDFETAYSYVVNRLPSPDVAASPRAANGTHERDEDDVSWRAAFHAGRHRGAASARGTTTSSPEVRRLEQRMELLSTAMLLAPSTALPDVLAAWRRCEEELLTLLAAENAAESEFDDRADAREVHIPGGFAGGGEPAFLVQPKRKELGRGAAEEAPMGLFEVARGAAAAFSRTAGGGAANKARGAAAPQSSLPDSVPSLSETDADGRVRKRDVVANAITGGLVSGVGWVLGAKPTGPE